MRVLLVQVNASSDRNPAVYPIGLSYVGTALKLKNHEAEILDLNVMEDPLASLRDKIKRMKPQVVGLSLKYASPIPHDCVTQCNSITKEIRKVGHPQTKIIMGGPGFTLFTEKLMKYVPELDYGVVYEGEESVPELLENLENAEKVKGILYRKDGKIIFSGNRKRLDFNSLPMPRRDLHDISNYFFRPYIIGVQTKRGCIVKCIYCAYSTIDGATLRMRRPEHVVDEIEHLVNVYGVKSIAFTDNVFNIPPDHAERICRNMIKRKVDVQWTAWLHPKYVTREFVELAKDAGCRRFEFSPDGFSDNSLKGLGKKMTKKDIINTYNIIKEVKGIEVRYNFFFWPPGQNIAALLEMAYFKLKLKLTLGRRLLNSKFGAIVLDESTKLYEIAVQQGLINEDTDLFKTYSLYWPSKWAGILYKMKESLRLIASYLKRITIGNARRYARKKEV